MAFLAGVRGMRCVFVEDRLLDYGAEWIVDWPLTMSDDGRTVACKLRNLKTERCCVGLDGRKGEEFDAIGAPALSRDGRTLAYRAQQGDRCFIVVGERKGPAYEKVTDPAVSADGTTVVYAAEREGRWRLVVDGRERPLGERPSSVFVSSTGASAGCVVQESRPDGERRARVRVDGAAGDSYELVGRPVFSPDGKTVAYAADDGDRKCIVIGRRRVESPGRITDPSFSADGRRVGYGAWVGRELWWKVENVE